MRRRKDSVTPVQNVNNIWRLVNICVCSSWLDFMEYTRKHALFGDLQILYLISLSISLILVKLKTVSLIKINLSERAIVDYTLEFKITPSGLWDYTLAFSEVGRSE